MLGLALLATGVVHADDTVAPAKPFQPVNLGYAFDRPDILLRQRLFGLAHGVHLLLSGCLDKNENADAAQQAYDAWYAAQRDVLDAVRGALAEYHFGPAAAKTHWQDIARVLGLRETIYPSLGTTTLKEACATLPQALAQSHYDFAAQLTAAGGSQDARTR